MSGRRWASLPKDEWPATGSHSHLVPVGGDTSACGTTALPLTIWRTNNTKPRCETCVERGPDHYIAT